jgi:hypothetical protein
MELETPSTHQQYCFPAAESIDTSRITLTSSLDGAQDAFPPPLLWIDPEVCLSRSWYHTRSVHHAHTPNAVAVS